MNAAEKLYARYANFMKINMVAGAKWSFINIGFNASDKTNTTKDMHPFASRVSAKNTNGIVT